MLDTIKQDLRNKLYQEEEFFETFHVDGVRDWCSCTLIITPTNNYWKIEHFDKKTDSLYRHFFEELKLVIEAFEDIKKKIMKLKTKGEI